MKIRAFTISTSRRTYNESGETTTNMLKEFDELQEQDPEAPNAATEYQEDLIKKMREHSLYEDKPRKQIKDVVTLHPEVQDDDEENSDAYPKKGIIKHYPGK